MSQTIQYSIMVRKLADGYAVVIVGDGDLYVPFRGGDKETAERTRSAVRYAFEVGAMLAVLSAGEIRIEAKEE